MAEGFFRYADVRQVHFELTSRCQAACPMCARNIQGGRTRGNIPMQDISLAEFEAWFSDDFLARLGLIRLCGNFGDPIIAKDCLPIVERFRAINPDAAIVMNTNGSARDEAFWEGLAQNGVTIRFGIDGARAESHERYRRKTDFDRILANARTFVAAGGEAIWDMLVFSHNDEEIDAATDLARETGFRQIVIKSTARFGGDEAKVQDDSGTVVDELAPSLRYPPAARSERSDPFVIRSCNIHCRVLRPPEIYVGASGHVFPCCWLGQYLFETPGVADSSFAQDGQHPGRQAKIVNYRAAIDAIGAHNLDLNHLPLEAIVSRSLPRFADHWDRNDKRLEVCARTCGDFGTDRFEATFQETRDLAPAT